MDLSTHAAVVNGEAYRDGKKIAHFDIDKVGDFLGDPGCFVWIGLASPDVAAMQALQSAFGLHELAVEDAQGAHERPKLEEYGDTLFMVMHTATLDGDAIVYGETHVFLGPRFIITVRHGASAGYAKLRERKESVPGKLASGPGYVLYSIIDFIVDLYQP
ncbi:MAG: CorA family divalent cation transporter, partial [Janthinobacterium sp.]